MARRTATAGAAAVLARAGAWRQLGGQRADRHTRRDGCVRPWAEAGCEGWSAADVLPIFFAIEDDPDSARCRIGRGGPMPVYRAPPESWGPVDRGLRDAALALGYPWNPDLNAPDGEGVSCYPINSRGGVRVSTNEAYLEPARARGNLTIRGGALVDRLLMDGATVVGVRVKPPDQGWMEIKAREVILCAGAVHSPAILWRSGLGPADELKRWASRCGVTCRRWTAFHRASGGARDDHTAAGVSSDRSGYASHELLRQLQLPSGRWRSAGHAVHRLQPSWV